MESSHVDAGSPRLTDGERLDCVFEVLLEGEMSHLISHLFTKGLQFRRL